MKKSTQKDTKRLSFLDVFDSVYNTARAGDGVLIHIREIGGCHINTDKATATSDVSFGFNASVDYKQFSSALRKYPDAIVALSNNKVTVTSGRFKLSLDNNQTAVFRVTPLPGTSTLIDIEAFAKALDFAYTMSKLHNGLTEYGYAFELSNKSVRYCTNTAAGVAYSGVSAERPVRLHVDTAKMLHRLAGGISSVSFVDNDVVVVVDGTRLATRTLGIPYPSDNFNIFSQPYTEELDVEDLDYIVSNTTDKDVIVSGHTVTCGSVTLTGCKVSDIAFSRSHVEVAVKLNPVSASHSSRAILFKYADNKQVLVACRVV